MCSLHYLISSLTEDNLEQPKGAKETKPRKFKTINKQSTLWVYGSKRCSINTEGILNFAIMVSLKSKHILHFILIHPKKDNENKLPS